MLLAACPGALIYTHQPSQATGQALVTMLDWLTHDGQAYAAANLYGPCQPRSGNSPAPFSARQPGLAERTSSGPTAIRSGQPGQP